MRKILWLICGSVLLLGARASEAALQGLETTRSKIGYDKKELLGLTAGFMKWAMGFLGILFFVMMLIGGIRWMSAQGDEKKVESAKNLLTAGVIGMIIVVAAFSITAFLGDTFTVK